MLVTARASPPSCCTLPFDAPLSQRVPRGGIGAQLGHWVHQAFSQLEEPQVGELLRFLVEDITGAGPDLPSYARKEVAELIKVVMGEEKARGLVEQTKLAPWKSVWSFLSQG